MFAKTLTDLEGTVLPSYMRESLVQAAAPTRIDGLLIGRVIQVYPPSDEKNLNQRRTEYDVRVVYADAMSREVNIVVYRCLVASAFGSLLDFEEWVPDVYPQQATPDTIPEQPGSWVLLQCVNGSPLQGVILGGYPSPDHPHLDGSKGRQWVRRIRGMEMRVDDEGRLTISVGRQDAATDAEGDKKAQVILNPDGTLELKTASGATVALDGGQSKVTVQATTQLGAGTESALKASTYRTQQSTLHNNLATALTSLTAVCANLALAAPVLEGFGAVGLTTSLTLAVKDVATAAGNLVAFEALAPTFLSQNHTLD